jgi:hypothetical protein
MGFIQTHFNWPDYGVSWMLYNTSFVAKSYAFLKSVNSWCAVPLYSDFLSRMMDPDIIFSDCSLIFGISLIMVTIFHEKHGSYKSKKDILTVSFLYMDYYWSMSSVSVDELERLYSEFSVYEVSGNFNFPFYLTGISAATHRWWVRPWTESKSVRHWQTSGCFLEAYKFPPVA